MAVVELPVGVQDKVGAAGGGWVATGQAPVQVVNVYVPIVARRSVTSGAYHAST